VKKFEVGVAEALGEGHIDSLDCSLFQNLTSGH
jgi:hypothetical protein